ncbi:MAG: putative toxin-antitoxin system toxin component, PIN family [Burkholderiales bacterium]|nr:putative toxin-antitoxin system toxin component, PIN family [Burkholderiales bacterium]
MIEQSLWVLDTNILISRLLLPGGVAARGVDHALVRGILLVFEASLAELTEVLGRPRFDPYASREDRQRFVGLMGGVSRIVHVERKIQACRDPKDDKFLDAALAGGARAIVTGDRDLLALNPFHDVPIISPAEFLAWP